VALGCEIVNFVGSHSPDNAEQAGGICHITVMQEKPAAGHVRIFVQVVDAFGIQQRAAALDAVDLVSLGQEKLRKVGAILASDSGD
jgi:hypothetical protein